MSRHAHCNSGNASIKERLLQVVQSHNSESADSGEIISPVIPKKTGHRNVSTLNLLLDWTRANFGEYSLNSMKTWTDDQIIQRMLKIKGIGLCTVTTMLCDSLGRDILPVNAAVLRIFSRTGVSGRFGSYYRLFRSVNSVIPYGKSRFLYRNLIEFGRQTCMVRQPACIRCPFGEICDYYCRKNDWCMS